MQHDKKFKRLILGAVIVFAVCAAWLSVRPAIMSGIQTGNFDMTHAPTAGNDLPAAERPDLAMNGGTDDAGTDNDAAIAESDAVQSHISQAEVSDDGSRPNASPEDASSDVSPETTKVSDEDAQDAEAEKEVITGAIKQGDTAEQLLAPFVTANSFQQILKASNSTHSLARIREGQPYSVVRSPEGTIETFEYEIDRDKKLVISRTETGFSADVTPIEYDIQTVVVRGEITSSLFQAIASTGENPDLAVQLATIFGSEINFIKDLREGDSFVLVLDKRYRDGEFRNYGVMHAARFINQGKTFEGFRFTSDTGAERYFNAGGENLAKTLLKAPLSFTRVTSGYSMSRKHPVFYDRRPHQGVDYGAPSGTPVKAVGDGVVKKSGWGNGFGNMVVIRHGGGLESMYSHLSGFAKNARSGAKVRQGQVIGYVGSTGVATGPHLDFRLKVNGKYVNPTKFVAPRGNPLPSGRKAAFARFVKSMQAKMS